MSTRLMHTAFSLRISDSEDISNVSSVVGDGDIFGGTRYLWVEVFRICIESTDESSGAWAESPWMVMIVANVATETPRHM